MAIPPPKTGCDPGIHNVKEPAVLFTASRHLRRSLDRRRAGEKAKRS
jgi:hypothetical protein